MMRSRSLVVTAEALATTSDGELATSVPAVISFLNQASPCTNAGKNLSVPFSTCQSPQSESGGTFWLLITESFTRTRPAYAAFAWYTRSEERRVGKECRSRWSPYQ